ncbi:unnamed protein product [Tetraodon nigroviridis]|uniref:(spotted green pufferfish) hypothetical protein n=1 Tax=Tetraodon nigroviridis TaxID=99883 RepID=Q4SSI8_TETNG|nr:unnamed protein product [Tetraodon nigroviridis]
MTDDMKPTHMLLFVLCPTLVLGFIYYSSRKLHLPAWGQKTQGAAEESAAAPTKGAEVRAETVYDKQGFLLQLDAKLSPELTYKYGNLSEGVCKPGFAAAKMKAIYPNPKSSAAVNLKRLGYENISPEMDPNKGNEYNVSPAAGCFGSFHAPKLNNNGLFSARPVRM